MKRLAISSYYVIIVTLSSKHITSVVRIPSSVRGLSHREFLVKLEAGQLQFKPQDMLVWGNAQESQGHIALYTQNKTHTNNGHLREKSSYLCSSSAATEENM